MGYISKDRKLTEKGDFAKLIYSNEILMGEIFGTDLYNGLSDIEILIVIATIIYEGRRGNKFSRHDVKQQVRKITNKLDRNNYVAKNLNITNMKCILPMVTAWANGCSFDELMEYSNLLEGDYIRLFRQVIDFLRQIRRATTDHDLIDKVEDGIRRIDRDVVAVEF
jgi:superfamily II RNA helicase